MTTIRKPLLAAASVLFLVLGLLIVAATAHVPLAHASTCTISNDTSAPAEIQATASTSASKTTANFSPPANSLVLVEVVLKYNSVTGTGPTVTVTDSGSNSYTAGPSAYDGSRDGVYMFTHYFSTAPGSGNITAHRSGATGSAMFDVKVRVLTGAAASQAGAAASMAHSTSGTVLTTAMTPTAVGSDVEAVLSTTPNQSGTDTNLTSDSVFNDSTDNSVAAGGHHKTANLTAGTIGWTVSSSAAYSVAALEVLPSNSCGSGGSLTWSPPACGGGGYGCVDLNLSNTGSHQTPTLSDSNDYRIHLPSSGPLVGGITLLHGHNIQIIGGEIDLTYPCANDASNCMGLYIAKESVGEVYVEGVWIHNPSAIPASCSPTGQPCSTGDGIGGNAGSTTYPITLQNVRVDGISGCSGGGDHADVFQPYQIPGSTVHIDHMTGTTNCQGFQIDPDLASANPPNYTIKNANIDVISNPYSGNNDRYGYWFTDTCSSGSVSLTNVYEQEPSGSLASNAIWPDTGSQTPACQSTYSAPTYTFHNTSITGVVTNGQPAGGDYVTGGGTGAGTGYVSPGYM